MNEECSQQLQDEWDSEQPNRLTYDDWIKSREADWKHILSQNQPKLAKAVIPDSGLFTHLASKKVFDRRTLETFKLQTGHYAQVSAVLNALQKQPFTGFIGFCGSLIETNQTHVIRELLTPEMTRSEESKEAESSADTKSVQSPVKPVDFDWKSLIRQNFAQLIANIEPDSGLIDHLVSKRVVSDVHVDVIKSQKGRSNRVTAILDHLTQTRPDEDFQKFCDALKMTNQQHVVEWYLTRGTSQLVTGAGSTRHHQQDTARLSASLTPLCRDWKRILMERRTSIVDELTVSDELVDVLVQKEVMNLATSERFREEEETVRAESLLDHLQRRSDDDFVRFCEALQMTGQSHVVDTYLSETNETLVTSVELEAPPAGDI